MDLWHTGREYETFFWQLVELFAARASELAITDRPYIWANGNGEKIDINKKIMNGESDENGKVV